MKKIVVSYPGNKGAKSNPDRTFPAPLTLEQLFGFNNGTDKDPTPAPYKSGAGGAFMLPAEGISGKGTTPMRLMVTRMSYLSDPLRPLVVTIEDGYGKGEHTQIVKGGQYFNLHSGEYKCHVAFQDGKAGMVDLEVTH